MNNPMTADLAVIEIRAKIDKGEPITPREQEYIMLHLPVRRITIFCIDNPDWGTWGVYEDKGLYYEIHGGSGGRVLSKSEAVKFWAVKKNEW